MDWVAKQTLTFLANWRGSGVDNAIEELIQNLKEVLCESPQHRRFDTLETTLKCPANSVNSETQVCAPQDGCIDLDSVTCILEQLKQLISNDSKSSVRSLKVHLSKIGDLISDACSQRLSGEKFSYFHLNWPVLILIYKFLHESSRISEQTPEPIAMATLVQQFSKMPYEDALFILPYMSDSWKPLVLNGLKIFLVDTCNVIQRNDALRACFRVAAIFLSCSQFCWSDFLCNWIPPDAVSDKDFYSELKSLPPALAKTFDASAFYTSVDFLAHDQINRLRKLCDHLDELQLSMADFAPLYIPRFRLLVSSMYPQAAYFLSRLILSFFCSDGEEIVLQYFRHCVELGMHHENGLLPFIYKEIYLPVLNNLSTHSQGADFLAEIIFKVVHEKSLRSEITWNEILDYNGELETNQLNEVENSVMVIQISRKKLAEGNYELTCPRIIGPLFKVALCCFLGYSSTSLETNQQPAIPIVLKLEVVKQLMIRGPSGGEDAEIDEDVRGC